MTDMGQEHELILFNDDVNTFDHVIEIVAAITHMSKLNNALILFISRESVRFKR